jgi:hypothetical protein
MRAASLCRRQEGSQMTFEPACVETLVVRSLRSRTAAIVGLLLLASVANVASAADPAVIADGILGDAIPALQNIIVSMSQGCSGGSNGEPPVGWGSLQVHGNVAINAFSAARTSLATKQNPVAVQQINSGLGELDVMINGLHNSCSGDSNGRDPVSYGAYVKFRDNFKTELQTVLKFL